MLGGSASESFKEWWWMLMVVRIILDTYRLMSIPRRNCRRIRRGSSFSRSLMNRMVIVMKYDTESL
jgi:hypothetical protein